MGCFRSLLVSFVFSVSLLFSVHGFRHDTDNVLQSLGLSIKPDIRKMNVSQEEFSKKMSMYLKRTRRSSEPRRFFTVRPEEVDRRESGEELLKFRSEEFGEAEGVTLKMLIVGSGHVTVYQRNDDGRDSVVSTKELSPPGCPVWVDSHLVPHLNENGSSSVLVARVSCGSDCQVVDPVLNVLTRIGGRAKRHADAVGQTDCAARSKKQRCCRHKMNVVFKQLPGYEYILQPYNFDAGFCKGGCPYRYNAANDHARIQSAMYRMRMGGAPKPCCSPSKLDSLEVLHLDEHEPSKLKITKMKHARVTECACS